MKKKPGYILLTLEERNGEHEYTHKSVHKLPNLSARALNKFADKYLRNFYLGGKPTAFDDGYLYHDDTIFAKVYAIQIITKEEYEILNKYL